MFQVVCIYGVLDSYRCDEIVKAKSGYVQQKADILLVTVPEENKTNKARFFTISPPFAEIVIKYMSLRPTENQERFFLNY